MPQPSAIADQSIDALERSATIARLLAIELSKVLPPIRSRGLVNAPVQPVVRLAVVRIQDEFARWLH
jgi:hypothetical protein